MKAISTQMNSLESDSPYFFLYLITISKLKYKR